MKLRGVAGLAVFLLGATILLTGCDDKTAGSPAPTQTTGSAGGGGDFCKLLYAKSAELKSGKDASQMSHDELQGITDALGELEAAAPAEIKGALGTMHQIYSDVAAGKTKTSDEAEMKKVAEASLKYVQWTVSHCPPPGS
jgi:hypothetical protein